MRWLAMVLVMSPTVASGQDYSFGDWARDQGYSPGDVMPSEVDAGCPWNSPCSPGIGSLDGIGEFDWTTRLTTELWLHGNQIASIDTRDFSELTKDYLNLNGNQISSIDLGDFSGLTELTKMGLGSNQLLSIESGNRDPPSKERQPRRDPSDATGSPNKENA